MTSIELRLGHSVAGWISFGGQNVGQNAARSALNNGAL